MGITVNTNIAAISAYQNLDKTSDAFNTSLGRLSSGMKINTAADDAAGYVISQQLQRQSNSYGVAINNAQDGVSVLQTAQGALNQTTSILQRMNELAMRAANGTSTDNTARTADNQEFSALQTQLDQIANSTVFGGANLLDGSYNATFQVGTDASANSTVSVGVTNGLSTVATSSVAKGTAVTFPAVVAAAQTFNFTINGGAAVTATLAAGTYANAAALAAGLSGTGVTFAAASPADGSITMTGTATGSGHDIAITAGGAALTSIGFAAATVSQGAAGATGSGFGASALGVGSLNISTQAGASGALATVKNALDSVTQAQATMGAAQNRLTVIATNLGVGQQNLQAANSRLVDTDMAQEMTTFSSLQILKQVGTSMLAQAQQAPQTILKLIQ